MIPSPDELAPGDRAAAALDTAGFEIHRIRRIQEPLFETGYAALWEEFGACGEMERRATLEARFGADTRFLYEMAVVLSRGRLAAVRDHTAVAMDGAVVVHLSHNLVLPEWRRTGLAGWMRALPVHTGRRCAEANGLPPGAPLVLVAEMEFFDPLQPATGHRLKAYEKAGFKKVDPRAFAYHQPDFRAPEQIDASGGAKPLPFQLVLRRLGREGETAINGKELRTVASALRDLYAEQLRPADMAHPALSLERCPGDSVPVVLLAPTEGMPD
jgi:GNAT superfamily N-acetyltransferase